MLRRVDHLHNVRLGANDGELGSVDDLLFDDQRWIVRYLVVDTGGWLSGRRVLISPISITAVRWDDQRIDVALTQRQVEQSPDISTDLPVSRQKEQEYFNYYGYPPYWGGAGAWGAGWYPGALAYPGAVVPYTPVPPTSPATGQFPTQDEGDPHLRSTREVDGYTIQARDGDLGHVADFLIDDESWALRYLVVDTRTWWPGKQVLITPRWISEVSWAEQRVRVDLPRAVIKRAPEYDPAVPLSRDYEARLHAYYKQPAYWAAELSTARGGTEP